MVCSPSLQRTVLLTVFLWHDNGPMKCLFLTGRWLCSKHQAVLQKSSLFPFYAFTIINLYLHRPPSSFLHEPDRRGKNMKHLLSEFFMNQAPKCHQSLSLMFHWPETSPMATSNVREAGKCNLSLCKRRIKRLGEQLHCFCHQSVPFSESEPISYVNF